RHRGAGTGTGPPDPVGRRALEKERREREDEDQPRNDEAQAADDRTCATADARGAVDRELGRGRAGKKVARRDRVLELVGVEPAAPIDAEPSQQRDVGGRATEAGAPDAPPLPRNSEQGWLLVHAQPAGASSSRTARSFRNAAVCRSERPAS